MRKLAGVLLAVATAYACVDYDDAADQDDDKPAPMEAGAPDVTPTTADAGSDALVSRPLGLDCAAQNPKPKVCVDFSVPSLDPLKVVNSTNTTVTTDALMKASYKANADFGYAYLAMAIPNTARHMRWSLDMRIHALPVRGQLTRLQFLPGAVETSTLQIEKRTFDTLDLVEYGPQLDKVLGSVPLPPLDTWFSVGMDIDLTTKTVTATIGEKSLAREHTRTPQDVMELQFGMLFVPQNSPDSEVEADNFAFDYE